MAKVRIYILKIRKLLSGNIMLRNMPDMQLQKHLPSPRVLKTTSENVCTCVCVCARARGGGQREREREYQKG